jgi:hypothetical protein
MASNIYTFVDATGTLTEVAASQLNFVGAYSPLVTYYRFDVVTSGLANFVCLTQNTAQPPPISRQFDSFWSVLAFTSVGTSSGGGGGGGVTSLNGLNGAVTLVAGANIGITQSGNNLIISASGTGGGGSGGTGSTPEWVMDWIGQTYNLATAGTTAANEADSWARDAFSIAVAGTNAANAVAVTAGEALNTAWTGTTSADQAYLLAQLAYNLAIRGTHVADNLIDSIVTDTGASNSVFDAIVTDLSGNVVVNSSGNVVSDETGKIGSVVIDSNGNVVARIIP